MPDIDVLDFETYCMHSNAMPFPLCLFARTGEVAFLNQAFKDTFGGHLMGRNFYSSWDCHEETENLLRNGEPNGVRLIRSEGSCVGGELSKYEWKLFNVGSCLMAVSESKSKRRSYERRGFSFQFSASGNIIGADEGSEAFFATDGMDTIVGNSIYEFVSETNSKETKTVFARSILRREPFCLVLEGHSEKEELSVNPLYDGDQFVCFLASGNSDYNKVSIPKLNKVVSRMGHDLKTPLNSILGFSRLLQDSELNPENSGYAKSIESGGRELLAMISDLVDLAKNQSEDVLIAKEWMSVSQFAQELKMELKYSPEETPGQIDFTCQENSNWEIEVDGVRLKKLILKVVDFLRSQSVDIEFNVQNVSLDSVFVVNLQCRSGGGVTDLLPLVALGRDHSWPEGESVTDFNLIVISEAVRSLGGVFESVDDDPSQLNIVFRSIEVRTLTGGEAFSGPLQSELSMFEPMSILGVDDSSLNRLVLTNIFKETPHSLTVVSSAQEALEYLERKQVDVIISDICMPEIDGIEMAAEIEYMADSVCRKIVFVSSDQMDLKERVPHSIEYGFVEKPPKAESFAIQFSKLGLRVAAGASQEASVMDMGSDTVKLLSACELNWSELRGRLACFKCDDWSTFRERMDLDELEAFAQELYEFGADNQSEDICHVALGVKAYLKEFDLASLGRVLEDIEIAHQK